MSRQWFLAFASRRGRMQRTMQQRRLGLYGEYELAVVGSSKDVVLRPKRARFVGGGGLDVAIAARWYGYSAGLFCNRSAATDLMKECEYGWLIHDEFGTWCDLGFVFTYYGYGGFRLRSVRERDAHNACTSRLARVVPVVLPCAGQEDGA